MNIIDIINKKRLCLELSNEEIMYVINGFVEGSIKDYQMSSLLMAICINGMSNSEISCMTKAMLNSGEKLDLSYISDNIVDKHSTGGVGDKTTLIVAPLVASCGIDVAKMSGRGLGHTGGTIDKLESIDGFNVNLTNDQFMNQVKDIGVAVISGSKDLVIADKKIYALRDVTATVESIPLIASSIMSKKIAAGTGKIVIDVKVGNGALMKNIDDARELAKCMINIGKENNVSVICVLSRMDEPLGYAIGNGLEVIESINMLKNNGLKDLKDLVIKLAATMVSLGTKMSIDDASKLVNSNLENGKAYDKFLELVKYQGGDINNVSVSSKVISVCSNNDGYISKIDAYALAELSRSLGAGRFSKEDSIDYSVGIVINKKVGDKVSLGEELAKVYYNNHNINIDDVLNCFEYSLSEVEVKDIVIDVITN